MKKVTEKGEVGRINYGKGKVGRRGKRKRVDENWEG